MECLCVPYNYFEIIYFQKITTLPQSPQVKVKFKCMLISNFFFLAKWCKISTLDGDAQQIQQTLTNHLGKNLKKTMPRSKSFRPNGQQNYHEERVYS
jgi:hypothetical protein